MGGFYWFRPPTGSGTGPAQRRLLRSSLCPVAPKGLSQPVVRRPQVRRLDADQILSRAIDVEGRHRHGRPEGIARPAMTGFGRMLHPACDAARFLTGRSRGLKPELAPAARRGKIRRMPHPSTWLRVLPQGLYCEPGGLFIDPLRAVDRAVVTHAHSDHARPGHHAVLASPDTLALMTARLGD